MSSSSLGRLVARAHRPATRVQGLAPAAFDAPESGVVRGAIPREPGDHAAAPSALPALGPRRADAAAMLPDTALADSAGTTQGRPPRTAPHADAEPTAPAAPGPVYARAAAPPEAPPARIVSPAFDDRSPTPGWRALAQRDALDRTEPGPASGPAAIAQGRRVVPTAVPAPGRSSDAAYEGAARTQDTAPARTPAPAASPVADRGAARSAPEPVPVAPLPPAPRFFPAVSVSPPAMAAGSAASTGTPPPVPTPVAPPSVVIDRIEIVTPPPTTRVDPLASLEAVRRGGSRHARSRA